MEAPHWSPLLVVRWLATADSAVPLWPGGTNGHNGMPPKIENCITRKRISPATLSPLASKNPLAQPLTRVLRLEKKQITRIK